MHAILSSVVKPSQWKGYEVMRQQQRDPETQRFYDLETGWGKRILTKITDPPVCKAEMRKVIEEIAKEPHKEALMHIVNITGVLATSLPEIVLMVWATEVQKWATTDELPPGVEC